MLAFPVPANIDDATNMYSWRLCRNFGADDDYLGDMRFYVVTKRLQTLGVVWHRVIGEISEYHLCRPLTLCRDRFVHPPPQFFFEGFQLRAHPIAPGFPLKLEVAGAGAPADMFELQKVESLRFS